MAVEVSPSELNAEVNVVTLTGKLDMSTSDEDSAALLEGLESSGRGIVIDMSGVDFLSSAGLRLLLSAFQKAEASDKQMPLISVHPMVYKIFKVSALDSKFQFFQSEEEAIAVFQ
jgi:anti-anti-sigma factor